MAKLIRHDGVQQDIAAPNLEQAQQHVGGYVELLSAVDGGVLLVDEDGRLKHKPANLLASDLYGRDFIVGDVVHMTAAEAKKAGWK